MNAKSTVAILAIVAILRYQQVPCRLKMHWQRNVEEAAAAAAVMTTMHPNFCSDLYKPKRSMSKRQLTERQQRHCVEYIWNTIKKRLITSNQEVYMPPVNFFSWFCCVLSCFLHLYLTYNAITATTGPTIQISFSNINYYNYHGTNQVFDNRTSSLLLAIT